ncbi:hypothetical protein [Pseudoxanthomonas indica]|uniref:hypothetical protein n=1 Tax=Pseudoxanthomonas indica TaxID=428993 RepID=UPI001115B955|nr:hypothetical protein [Pseudoxanthomonas indica]
MRFLFSLLLVVFGLLAMALRFHASHDLDDVFFNSDAMYLPTLFADVLAGSGELDHWYLTPAPYFFPDYLLFLPAYLITSVPFLQISVVSLLQVVVTLLLLAWLARRMRVRAPWTAAISIWLCLCWLAWNAGEPFAFLLVGSYHFGVFLGALACVALWFAHLQAGSSWRSVPLWMTCLLAAALTFSDQLFLVQAVTPFLAINLLQSAGDGALARKRLLQAIAVAGSSLVGSSLYPALVEHPMRYPVQLGLGQWERNARLLSEVLATLATGHLLYTLVLVAFLVLALVTIRRWRACAGSDEIHLGGRLTGFVLLSAAAACAVTLLHEGSPVALRYVIPMALWPVVATGMLCALRFRRVFVPVASSLSVLLVLSLLWQAGGEARAHGLRLRQYPDDIACIDQALSASNARHGIAEYWDAKQVQNLSRHRLRIAQYFDNLLEMRWITTADYYPTRYDFAIVGQQPDGKLSPLLTRVEDINGAAPTQVQCGKRLLLIYGRNRLRTVADLQLPGDRRRWRGCDLPTQIGTAEPDCEIGKRAPDLQGFLSFGPYVRLPAGNYRARVRYESEEAVGVPVGRWDVAVTVGQDLQVLQSAPLLGSGLQETQASGAFAVDTAQSAGLIEVRTVAEAPGAMKVIAVELERLP